MIVIQLYMIQYKKTYVSEIVDPNTGSSSDCVRLVYLNVTGKISAVNNYSDMH